MKNVVIAGAVRTPIGKFGGGLASLKAADLGTIAAKEAMNRAGVKPDEVNEFIFGNARQAGNGPNIARQISYRAGIPDTVTAYTVNKACASSIQTIVNGYHSIVMDDADIVVTGGTESMSNTPFLLTKARWGYRLGDTDLVDGMYRDGFLCPLCKQVMGATAENLAEKYKISREEQDEYAVHTQHRCEEARKSGRFKDEIVPVEITSKRGKTTFVETDEHPRDGVTTEKLAKLPAVFKEDGTVHAGNSSGITDAAAALVLLSEEKAKKLKVKPMARIVNYTSAGVDPAIMGIGPVPAIQKLLKKTGMKLDNFDLIELNEAFAAQVLACQKELNFDMEKVNVNGGAIALGHPIGATGTRIVVTLLHEMERRKAKTGLATLCVSGGMGMTLFLERSQ
jgi:acetyl-CoA C-acetyltransferase